jgi:hypothetical protein
MPDVAKELTVGGEDVFIAPIPFPFSTRLAGNHERGTNTQKQIQLSS